MLRLERVEEGDISELVELYLDSYKDLKDYSETTRSGAHHYLTWLYENCSGFFYKAKVQNRTVGFIAFDPYWERKGKRTLEIHEIVVLPEYRSQGIGTKMLMFALEVGRQMKNKEASLWVGRKNKKAIDWYKKMGFCQVGRWGKWLKFEKKI